MGDIPITAKPARVETDAGRDAALWTAFVRRAGLPATCSITQVVNAVKVIPYGRPSEATAEGVVREWRGTCSTKHALLAALVSTRWPETWVRVIHRVYEITPAEAQRLHGEAVARSIPAPGITDVHTYAVLSAPAGSVVVDVTFPGGFWDGFSDMSLACGPGFDVEPESDPWTAKLELIRRHCDPAIREPFIAALGRADDQIPGSNKEV